MALRAEVIPSQIRFHPLPPPRLLQCWDQSLRPFARASATLRQRKQDDRQSGPLRNLPAVLRRDNLCHPDADSLTSEAYR